MTTKVQFKRSGSTLADLFKRAWHVNPTLTLFVAFSAVMILVGLLGMLVDPRTVLAQPNWAKTTKFALSFVAYGATLLWVLELLRRQYEQVNLMIRIMGHTTGGVLMLELVFLIVQAVRGQPMHFNYATPLDTALWIAMGATVYALYAVTLVGLLALAFQRLSERSLSHGIKLGLVLSAVGMGLAIPMTSPSAVQGAALASGQHLDLIGAHTVGALDGGPGLPFLGWSTQHGDLRVAHFLGLHAAQVVPLAALWVSRRKRWAPRARVAVVWTGALYYLGLMLLTFFQALRGQSVIAPDALQLGLLSALTFAAALALFGIWLATRRDGAALFDVNVRGT